MESRAIIESSLPYFSFKELKLGAFNTGVNLRPPTRLLAKEHAEV